MVHIHFVDSNENKKSVNEIGILSNKMSKLIELRNQNSIQKQLTPNERCEKYSKMSWVESLIEQTNKRTNLLQKKV